MTSGGPVEAARHTSLPFWSGLPVPFLSGSPALGRGSLTTPHPHCTTPQVTVRLITVCAGLSLFCRLHLPHLNIRTTCIRLSCHLETTAGAAGLSVEAALPVPVIDRLLLLTSTAAYGRYASCCYSQSSSCGEKNINF